MAATLSFLSWIERGLGTALREPSAGRGPSVELAVDLVEQGRPSSRQQRATVRLDVASAAQVTGFDATQVINQWPTPNITDASAEFFPYVELADADLPWRYSPLRGKDATRSERVPWLGLLVLEEGEFRETAAGPGQPLAGIVIEAPDDNPLPLPEPSELALWTHLQFDGEPPRASELPAALASSPQRFRSRVVCPRFLAGGTRYKAFLVPLLRAGADTGLGREASAASVDWAWELSDREVALPVYHSWTFRTGEAGSFLELARRLAPRALGGGTRTLDVSQPGLPDLEGAGDVAPLGGVLRPLGATVPAWDSGERTRYRAALAALINEPVDLAPPALELAPPRYGRRYVDTDRIESGATAAGRWFQQLNDDPARRVAAALGTEVVRRHQQALVASAWEQAAGTQDINRQLLQLQFSRELTERLYRRHVLSSRTATTLYFSAPVHGQVLAGRRTVRGRLGTSPIPDVLFDPAWRRLRRPRGRLGRRQGRPTRPASEPDVLVVLNDGRLDPAAPPPLPGDMGTPGSGSQDCPACLKPEVVAAAAGQPLPLAYTLAEAQFEAARFYASFGGTWRGSLHLMKSALTLMEAYATPGGVPALERRLRVCAGDLEAADIDASPPLEPNWAPVEPVPDTLPNLPPEGTVIGPDEADFREAAKVLLDELGAPVPPGDVLEPVNLEVLANRTVERMTPSLTIGDATGGRLRRSKADTTGGDDPLREAQVLPLFERPMVEPLKDVSLEWILPGIGESPSNTVALVEPNAPFIEAYMVGANHEMSRELLWNEVPVDLSATFFRQFWDNRASGAAPDIAPIATWGDRALGAGLQPASTMLFVRGDLLHRFPQTVVYLAKATSAAPGQTEAYPLYRVRLGSDVGVYAFDVPVEELRDAPGWYLVFQEPPTEPRFGVEPATAGPLTPGTYLRANDEVFSRTIGPAASTSSGQVAAALFRNSVRVAIRGAAILPDEVS